MNQNQTEAVKEIERPMISPEALRALRDELFAAHERLRESAPGASAAYKVATIKIEALLAASTEPPSEPDQSAKGSVK